MSLRELLSAMWPELGVPEFEAQLLTLIAREQQQEVDSEALRGFTEADVVLIAYPNHLQSEDGSPLGTLDRWLAEYWSGLLSIVHVLPFHTSTSYDGYAIVDFQDVSSEHGTWADLHSIGQHGFELMFDLVLNHCSSAHEWVQQFKRAEEPGRRFLIGGYDPAVDGEWLSKVKRARNSTQVLQPCPMVAGEQRKYLWCTYHPDLVDLNWDEPDMLLEWTRIILQCLQEGARFFRLDAFAYVVKERNTDCLNRPRCKTLLALLKKILQLTGRKCAVLPSITNVTQQQNYEYLQHGADLVYCLPLAALLLFTLYSGNASIIAGWLARLPPAPHGRSLLNLASSHDGIGLSWCRDILSPSEIDFLIEQAVKRGSLVQYRRETDDPDSPSHPWEINATLWSACRPLEDSSSSSSPSTSSSSSPCSSTSDTLWLDRFFAVQLVVLVLKGVPALYLSLLVGGENDVETVNRVMTDGRAGIVDPNALCAERLINRQRFSSTEWRARVVDGSSVQARLLTRWQHVLRVRKNAKALHPDCEQEVMSLADYPSLLLVARRSTTSEHVLVSITNFGDEPIALTAGRLLCADVQLPLHLYAPGGGLCFELVQAPSPVLVDLRTELVMPGYQTLWLVPFDQPSSELSISSLCHIGRRSFFTPEWLHAHQDQPSTTCSWQDSPAAFLGLSPHPSDRPLRFSVVDRFPSPSSPPPTSARRLTLHLVRHGISLHKDLAPVLNPTSPSCRCYYEGVSVATRNACPSMHPSTFDSPLSIDGRRQVALLDNLPEHVTRIYSGCDTRSLQTAEILRDRLPGSPQILVREDLRPLINTHIHTHRSRVSTLRRLFPSIDFPVDLSEEDPLFHRAMASGYAHELRDSCEARLRHFLQSLFSDVDENGEVLVVGHFTVLWLLFAPASDHFVFKQRIFDSSDDPIISTTDEDALRVREWMFGQDGNRLFSVTIEQAL